MSNFQGSLDSQKTTVKCKDCGYLAWRHRNTWELIEVDLEHREGTADSLPSMAIRKEIVMSQEVCFCAAHDLRAEELSPAKSQEAVIWKDRVCTSYTKWCPGLSPKEHMQMHLLEEQRKREDERDAAQREWQKVQEQERRDWEAAQSRLALQTEEARHDRSIRWSVIGVAVGVLLTSSLQLLSDLVKAKWISPNPPAKVHLLTPEYKSVSTDVKPTQ